jgi:hypothetical protein
MVVTSWKVAGSAPDKVVGIFNRSNPSSRNVILGSTQPLTEMNTRDLPGGKDRSVRKVDNLTAICEPIVWKMWEPRRLTTLWASEACYRDSFIFSLSFNITNFFLYAEPLVPEVCTTFCAVSFLDRCNIRLD